MRFGVSCAVLASPIVCLWAVVILDAPSARRPETAPAAAPAPQVASLTARDDTAVTGSIRTVSCPAVRRRLQIWRADLGLTPAQIPRWHALVPGTATLLARRPSLRHGASDLRDNARVRTAWIGFAETFSPRQRLIYQRTLVPVLWGSTRGLCRFTG